MTKYLIGIDEAGRGPLAGPVTVGAVLIPRNLKILNIKKLRDSKKLTQSKREEWFVYIKKHPKIFFAVSSVSAKSIDKIGIQKATALALSRVLAILTQKLDLQTTRGVEVLLDGSLYAPVKYKKQKTIIKGDEKIPVISLASIVAKVTRDRKMVEFSKKYNNYDFEIHKGYGTKKHYDAIKKYGPSYIHRKTYLRNMSKNH
jgi:ribonuclease HII